MSLSDLASLGSFVSGVAVLASLIFLVLQVRQNTEAVRASASDAHENEIHQIIGHVIAEDDVAELLRSGLAEIEGLSANQRVRFLVFMNGLMRYYQASWLAWQKDRLDNGLWYTVEQQIRDTVRQPGFLEFWKIRSHWYTLEFRAWVDALPKPRPERGLYDLASKAADAGSPQTIPS